jgi:hypothetical protein
VLGGALVFAASQEFRWFGLDDDSGAGTTVATAATRVDRFDEDRAMALLREQTDRYGFRPAGSPALRRLAVRLRDALPGGRLEPIPGHPGLQNVVGVVPGRRPGVVVGAHYDTNDTPKGYLGANDGAAGSAAVVELARTLRRAKRPKGAPEIRFVLFDGEEAPSGCEPFDRCGLRGSKAYVKAHRRQVGAMVLLDYIAGKGTRLPREASSDVELWERVRAAARRVGASRTFPDDTGIGISDDHTPFLQASIPAVDLIDWDYRRYAHTLQDTPARISVPSLNAVGETIADLLIHWRS